MFSSCFIYMLCTFLIYDFLLVQGNAGEKGINVKRYQSLALSYHLFFEKFGQSFAVFHKWQIVTRV